MSRSPNILFIMSDDHTTQALGVYGGHLQKLNPTPNLDKLAKNGLRFDRVFCELQVAHRAVARRQEGDRAATRLGIASRRS